MAKPVLLTYEKFIHIHRQLADKIANHLQDASCVHHYVLIINQPNSSIDLHEVVKQISSPNANVLIVVRENCCATLQGLEKHGLCNASYYLEHNAQVILEGSIVSSDLMQSIFCEEKSAFVGTLLAIDPSTVAITITLLGQEASATVQLACMTRQGKKSCIRTKQLHDAVATTSCIEIKGIVYEGATLDHRGDSVIGSSAGSAKMMQKTKVLAVGNNINFVSRPCFGSPVHNVHCVHASALAKCDEQQQWYMASRGLHNDKIQHMLVEAFLNNCFKTLNADSKKHMINTLKKMMPT